MTNRATLPAGSAVGRVALRVGDLGETVGFYRDVVGLAVHGSTDERAVLGDGETDLLVLLSAPDAAPRRRSAAGLFHTAFRVPDRASLADALRRVRDRWSLDGASDHGVSEALYLSDPEGNGVELYRDRPRSTWPTAAEGRVAMVTEPLALDDLAAESEGAARVPTGTDVGHVHLEVTSIPETRSFYVDALGLRVRQAYGDDAVFLAAGDYHHHVGANVWRGRTDPASDERRGLAWFEVVVPDHATLEAAVERLTDAGVAVDRTDGVAVDDPDGIRVRLRAQK